MEWSGTILKTCLHIIIVSLNPGKRLQATLTSVFSQDYKDYKIIIKDGGSNDGAIEDLKDSGFLDGHEEVVIVSKKDKSIYDGMNQAVEYMQEEIGDQKGAYCMFLNCGDEFHDSHVLSKVASYLKEYDTPHIFYGDQYNLIQKSKVSSAPEINDFALFRNVPCHQVCFYSTELFKKRAYDIKYTVRADYEHFLYSFYEENAVCTHMDVIVCNYEGGGYSETAENRKKSALQHREITDKYMAKQAKKYRTVMLLTLAPLRTKMAESPTFSKAYNGLKSAIYKIKK